jgi:leucyl aminopeptidase
MSYISDKYKLDTIITTATLTGACMVALGYNYA